MKYLKNVTTLKYNKDKCVGCGYCVEVCPQEVFSFVNRKALLNDSDDCMECGACAMNCPSEAITVRAGVGCAYAIIIGKIRGTEPTCGCSTDETSCC